MKKNEELAPIEIDTIVVAPYGKSDAEIIAEFMEKVRAARKNPPSPSLVTKAEAARWRKHPVQLHRIRSYPKG